MKTFRILAVGLLTAVVSIGSLAAAKTSQQSVQDKTILVAACLKAHCPTYSHAAMNNCKKHFSINPQTAIQKKCGALLACALGCVPSQILEPNK